MLPCACIILYFMIQLKIFGMFTKYLFLCVMKYIPSDYTIDQEVNSLPICSWYRLFFWYFLLHSHLAELELLSRMSKILQRYYNHPAAKAASPSTQQVSLSVYEIKVGLGFVFRERKNMYFFTLCNM